MGAIASGQLISMPLRAITDALGEDGLRARFALEIGRFDPPDRVRLTGALAFVTDLHRGDRRIHEPYINHLLRVSIRMMCYYEVRDVDVVIAGLLHDSVEDHAAELADAAGGATADAADPHIVDRAFSTIEIRFGPRVAQLVAAVTNPSYDPGRDADEQYREHLATSLAGNAWARVIKVSDFTDNGVGVLYASGPKVARAATKYRPLVPILRDLIGRPDTPLSRWVKRHIFDQLDLAESRFREILDKAAAEPLPVPTREPAAEDGARAGEALTPGA